MKRFVIKALILLATAVDPINISMGAEGQNSQSDVGSQLMMQFVNSLQKASYDPNVETDPNEAIDPNTKGTESQQYNDLHRALRRLDSLSRDEVKKWTANNGDNRLDLAKAVQKQVEDELKFLRKVAKEEGCGITAEAIKRLLVLREERFTHFIKELENTSTRKRGRSQRTERSDREQSMDPIRPSRNRDSDLQGMSSEERRRAWEERRRAERERRMQERNAQRNRSQQDNRPDYSAPNP
ncbi:MAG: hypothetical protein ACYS9Y_06265 [Planctomycetota bacterium]|jgi:hypothetical protein